MKTVYTLSFRSSLKVPTGTLTLDVGHEQTILFASVEDRQPVLDAVRSKGWPHVTGIDHILSPADAFQRIVENINITRGHFHLPPQTNINGSTKPVVDVVKTPVDVTCDEVKKTRAPRIKTKHIDFQSPMPEALRKTYGVVNLRQASDLLLTPEATVLQLIRSGKLPAIVDGGNKKPRYSIKTSDLKKLYKGA